MRKGVPQDRSDAPFCADDLESLLYKFIYVRKLKSRIAIKRSPAGGRSFSQVIAKSVYT